MGLKDNEIKRLWRNRDLPPMKMIQCIADLSAWPYSIARNRCEELGLIEEGQYVRCKDNVGWESEQVKALATMWRKGYSTEQISLAIQRSKRSVENKIRRMIDDGSMF